MADKSREQYEEWFKKEFDAEMAKYGEKLVDFVKKEHFKIWQASRECLEVELPERKNYSGFQQFDNGYERAIDDCENILISNGVKIKND